MLVQAIDGLYYDKPLWIGDGWYATATHFTLRATPRTSAVSAIRLAKKVIKEQKFPVSLSKAAVDLALKPFPPEWIGKSHAAEIEQSFIGPPPIPQDSMGTFESVAVDAELAYAWKRAFDVEDVYCYFEKEGPLNPFVAEFTVGTMITDVGRYRVKVRNKLKKQFPQMRGLSLDSAKQFYGERVVITR